VTLVGRRDLGLLYYESEDEKKNKSPGEVVLLLFFPCAAQLSFALEEKFSQPVLAHWLAQYWKRKTRRPTAISSLTPEFAVKASSRKPNSLPILLVGAEAGRAWWWVYAQSVLMVCANFTWEFCGERKFVRCFVRCIARWDTHKRRVFCVPTGGSKIAHKSLGTHASSRMTDTGQA